MTGKHLKVGELARSTGLTVRTLHHYDEIGLLAPSGRSESGYRLYSPDDVARLHGIQALRQMGLPLAGIADVLGGRGAAPEAIIEQQMLALEREIERARHLRDQLGLIREQLATGGEPDVGDWLGVLESMATYGKYFSPQELRKIFADYAPLKEDWAELVEDVQAAMARGCAIDSAQVQSLARRWMSLMLSWMRGDFELMRRWGDMYLREPEGAIARDAPPLEVIEFMRHAIDLRMAAIRNHFTPDDLARIRHIPESEWRSLEAQVQRLLAAGEAPGSESARAVAKQWLAVMDRLVDGDAAVRDKMIRTSRDDPLLALSSPLSQPVRAFIGAALQKMLDPHVT